MIVSIYDPINHHEVILWQEKFFIGSGKLQDGAKTPRYRIVAVSGVDLKIFAEHLRKSELEHLAREVGADLIELERAPNMRQRNVKTCEQLKNQVSEETWFLYKKEKPRWH